MNDQVSFIGNLLNILLPQGGYAMSFASVFIDESGTDDDSPAMCLAGFLYEKDHAQALTTRWQAILDRERMPHLHMKQWTKPGSDPYAHLDMERRIFIQRELIELVQEYKSLAFISATVPEKSFADLWKTFKPEIIGMTAYTFCLADCLRMVSQWACNHDFSGKIAYFFESGHRHGRSAKKIIDHAVANPTSREAIRHGSHTFINKTDNPAIQTADMIAWLSLNYLRRSISTGKNTTNEFFQSGECMRADYKALLKSSQQHQTASIHRWDEPMIKSYHAILAGKTLSSL